MDEAGGEIVVYTSPDGGPRVQLRAVEGTVWLAQAEIASLYDTSVSNVAHIVRRILQDGEVSRATVDSESRVAQEGRRRVRREVKIYNLDMILAIGYRVSSPRAVQFRRRATTNVLAQRWEDPRICKADAVVAKNYFMEQELDDLRELTALEQRRDGP